MNDCGDQISQKAMEQNTEEIAQDITQDIRITYVNGIGEDKP